MSYSLKEIKQDISSLSEKEFYIKYIIRSENWYFENMLSETRLDVLQITDEYRLIISEKMGVTVNSIMMVGSGKLGYSLSPPNQLNPEMSKTFKPFNTDEKIRKPSDLDIVIVSDVLFHKYWGLFREGFIKGLGQTYRHIFNEIFRGYINERNITEVPRCREEWLKDSKEAKKCLRQKLYITSEINFRIYRSWKDFEDYNIQNIRELKRGLQNEI